jgi:hypothetical protein
MTASAHLRLVDTTTGEIFEHAAMPAVGQQDNPVEENRALRSALTRAENVIKGLRAQLAAERQKTRRTYPIDDAFEDWKAKIVAAGRQGMKRAKLSDDRIDSMGKMFEAGYTLEDFRLASTGIAEFQFVVYGKRRQHGSDDARDLCIGKVCEKARRFEEAARLGAIVEKARQA